jgi:hypothetical protein
LGFGFFKTSKFVVQNLIFRDQKNIPNEIIKAKYKNLVKSKFESEKEKMKNYILISKAIRKKS